MKSIVAFYVIVCLTSCGGATHYLSSGRLTETSSYEVNSYYGCCGCKAGYFNILTGKKISEQVIYSYNCPRQGLPSKFIFTHNKTGKITGGELYVATTGNDHTIAISDHEKKLFAIVDFNYRIVTDTASMIFTQITGFRKPSETERHHKFPLLKKGYKLEIH